MDGSSMVVGQAAGRTAEARGRDDRIYDVVTAVAIALGMCLRTWMVWSHRLTFDESFTASAATRSPGDLVDFLRHNDTHPPLDYLIRAPLADFGSEVLLRAPSLVLSLASLLVLRRWMRGRGLFGCSAVVIASISAFWILHGREARMYALIVLLGVIAARGSARWLQSCSFADALTVSGACLVAMWSQPISIVFVGSLALLPGVRRDRAAWIWRLTMAGSVMIWALTWGPAFADQAQRGSPSWIPATTWAELAGKLAQLVNYRFESAILIVPAMVFGMWRLAKAEPTLARLSAIGFVLPTAAIAIVGIWQPSLLARSLAFGAWAPVLALAALTAWMHEHFSRIGTALMATLAVLLLLVPAVMRVREPVEPWPEIDAAIEASGPGDEITMDPVWLSPLLDWELRIKRGWSRVEGDPGVFISTEAEPTGRRWVLSNLVAGGDVDQTTVRCAQDRVVNETRLLCLASAGG